MILLTLFCIGFLLTAGCTTTTPAQAPVTTTVAPEPPAPVETTIASPPATEPVVEETTVLPATAVTTTTASRIKIFTTTKSYSPATAATHGLEMSVITSLDTSTAKYDWTASDGHFVVKPVQSEIVNVVGPSISNNGGKVYWTFTGSHAKDGVPVTITVVVSEASGRELGRSTATLNWQDANTVTVAEIV